MAKSNLNESGRGRRVKTIGSRQKTVTLFARQMSTLLAAGLPILRSLETLKRQESNKRFAIVLESLAGRVRSGSSFSDALALYPKIFDGLLLNMVKAGEAGGNLDVVLSRVAEFREKSARVVGKVKAAMVYPAIVISVAVVIVGLLMAFVVPQFQAIFDGQLRGQPLPALTQLIIDLSHMIKDRFLLMVGVAFALIFLIRLGMQTVPGKSAVDWSLFCLPLIGSIVKRTAIARFARTFGTLLRAGVPMLESILITRAVVGNSVVQKSLLVVHDRVRDGDSVAGPLEQTRVFPPMVASMIDVGEETGQLPDMCDRVADNYEDELDNVVSALTSIIEPIMIVILAVVVGTVVIGLFLPIVSIIQNISTR